MAGQVIVSIDPRNVEIAPGQQGRVAVRLVNKSGVVNQFVVSLLGLDPRMVPPPQRIGLFPEQEGTVVFPLLVPAERPPHAGTITAAARITSENDYTLSVVEEFQFTTAPAPKATAHMQPLRLQGRKKAKFTLFVNNEGNTPLRVGFRGEDDQGQVSFEFRPPWTDVPAGQTAATSGIAYGKRINSGPAGYRTLMLHVDGAPTPLVVNSSFLQKSSGLMSILRAVLITALVAVIAGAIIFAAKIASQKDPVQLFHPPTLRAKLSTQVPPALVDQQFAAVRQKLEEAGFKLDPIVRERSDKPKDTVIKTVPASGEHVKADRKVAVFVSAGPAPVFAADTAKWFDATGVAIPFGQPATETSGKVAQASVPDEEGQAADAVVLGLPQKPGAKIRGEYPLANAPLPGDVLGVTIGLGQTVLPGVQVRYRFYAMVDTNAMELCEGDAQPNTEECNHTEGQDRRMRPLVLPIGKFPTATAIRVEATLEMLGPPLTTAPATSAAPPATGTASSAAPPPSSSAPPEPPKTIDALLVRMRIDRI